MLKTGERRLATVARGGGSPGAVRATGSADLLAAVRAALADDLDTPRALSLVDTWADAALAGEAPSRGGRPGPGRRRRRPAGHPAAPAPEPVIPGQRAAVPRLVATDLDGTLLRRDGTLSDRTRRTLAAIVAAGAELVIVTARPPRYVRAVADELGLRGTAICANGAISYDLASGEWTVRRPLPVATAQRVAAALAAPGVGFAVETGARLVYEPGYGRRDDGDIRLAVPAMAELWRLGQPIGKLLVWSAALTGDALLTTARSRLGAEVTCTHSGGSGLLEVSAAGATKAAALAQLCASRGISATDVMAFGDMPNDLDMLDWAGTGYAVANAHPSVLAARPTHTAANDDDGVAQILEALLVPPRAASPG